MKLSELKDACEYMLHAHGNVEVEMIEPGSFCFGVDGRPASRELEIVAALGVERQGKVVFLLSTDDIPPLLNTLTPGAGVAKA